MVPIKYVINRYTPDYTQISVVKDWNDAVELNEGNNWSEEKTADQRQHSTDPLLLHPPLHTIYIHVSEKYLDHFDQRRLMAYLSVGAVIFPFCQEIYNNPPSAEKAEDAIPCGMS